MKIGIYEQIINQLFEEKISSIDQTRFYIGERTIESREVVKLLSMYLSNIFEQVLSEVVVIDDDEGEEDGKKKDTIKKGVDLANAIIRKLVDEFNLESGNLVSAQAKILTAVIDKTQSDYPDLAKRLEEIMPMWSPGMSIVKPKRDWLWAILPTLLLPSPKQPLKTCTGW